MKNTTKVSAFLSAVMVLNVASAFCQIAIPNISDLKSKASDAKNATKSPSALLDVASKSNKSAKSAKDAVNTAKSAKDAVNTAKSIKSPGAAANAALNLLGK